MHEHSRFQENDHIQNFNDDKIYLACGSLKYFHCPSNALSLWLPLPTSLIQSNMRSCTRFVETSPPWGAQVLSTPREGGGGGGLHHLPDPAVDTGLRNCRKHGVDWSYCSPATANGMTWGHRWPWGPTEAVLCGLPHVSHSLLTFALSQTCAFPGLFLQGTLGRCGSVP